MIRNKKNFQQLFFREGAARDFGGRDPVREAEAGYFGNSNAIFSQINTNKLKLHYLGEKREVQGQ